MNLLLTIVLSGGIILLGAGTVLRVWQMLGGDKNVEKFGQMRDAESDNTGSMEEFVENSFLLAKLCSCLEEELQSDEALHIYSVSQAPKEYDIWEILSGISQISESGLTDDEWLLYQKLCWSEECYEEACQLPDYASQLSDLTGILNKLPEVFYTWHFGTKEDVEAYEVALMQIPDMLDRLADSLTEQSLAGIVYPESVLEKQIQNCREQLMEESIFLEDFERRVRSCDFLSKEEQEVLIHTNRNTVEECVWDSYKNLIYYLENIQPAGESRGLGAYPEGKEYYEHLLKVTTGSDKSVDEMYVYLEGKRELVKEKLLEMNQADEPIELRLFSLSAEDTIYTLYDHMIEYPDFPQINYVIALIPPKQSSALYQAFYLKDGRSGANYIYIGEDMEKGSWLSLYQTLAHEALPGHMYCYNFPRRVMYPSLEGQIKCMGYSEGWALYAELSAAAWLPEQSLTEAYLKQFYQKLYDEIVLSQIDIGIHAMDWTLEDIEDFSMKAYGAGSREASKAVMETLSLNPGAYQVYVIGYYEIEELREKYCTGNERSEWEFIEAYMQCGQAPFWIVDAYMDRVFGAQAYEMP